MNKYFYIILALTIGYSGNVSECMGMTVTESYSPRYFAPQLEQVAHVPSQSVLISLGQESEQGAKICYAEAVNNKQKDAVASYKQLIYLSRDLPMAAFEVATMLENGIGCDKSQELAITYYEIAANKDYAPAQRALGYLYESGNGVERDIKRAVDYYVKAIDNNDKLAMDNLERLLEENSEEMEGITIHFS